MSDHDQAAESETLGRRDFGLLAQWRLDLELAHSSVSARMATDRGGGQDQAVEALLENDSYILGHGLRRRRILQALWRVFREQYLLVSERIMQGDSGRDGPRRSFIRKGQRAKPSGSPVA